MTLKYLDVTPPPRDPLTWVQKLIIGGVALAFAVFYARLWVG